VDLFHAREHLHELARSLEFMLLDRKDEWLAARLEDLDYGGIGGICRAAREILREAPVPAHPAGGLAQPASRPFHDSDELAVLSHFHLDVLIPASRVTSRHSHGRSDRQRCLARVPARTEMLT
jgi:hypothetical protein